ncbi:Nucleoside-diphosphate sugar epimerase/dehydratase [hydrothermal vent metagenome]|uniref:Nucleoside-diphosphate sugar epimerase/dehydratase n=1 Tax=hydrothermal vent metagenome TaxID=652676 RepID=A0A3B0YM98_9ZZZZ
MNSRTKKRIILLLMDVVLVPVALWFSFSLRLGEIYIPGDDIPYLFLLAPFISIPIFIRFGLYNAVIRYIGFQALWAVMQAVTFYALIWGVIALMSGAEGVLPRSVIIINLLITGFLIGGSRMFARWWLAGINPMQRLSNLHNARKNVIIYGAGAAGVQVATALSFGTEYKPVAFIDDDPFLKNHRVNGYKVHSFTHLGFLLEKHNVTEVLLAIPSASRSQRNKIVNLLEPYSVRVLTLPSIDELAQGKVKADDIRDVEIADLLGRDSVAPNPELLHENINEKTVLVTGAGGSIGSELCRQIIQLAPRQLILFDHSEYALYSIEKELNCLRKKLDKVSDDFKVIPILGNICNQHRLEKTCGVYGVQTIYHAAAYKHVPLVESNPAEAIRNNILGTLRTANAAINTKVETFVLISTDKAVRPTNTMGATKRFAELILQGLTIKNNTETRFCMVRFGNVLGSSGSVVPLFREQIASGGPITVTDSKIIRYFMTIPEAAQLVIQAGAMGKGGDVFVLDMGEPVNIYELAKKLIRLSGLEVKSDEQPDGDIEIKITGLRHGEKLYEELLIGDNVTSTRHSLIMRAEEEVLPWAKIQHTIDAFEDALNKCDQEKIREILLDVVKGYSPQCSIEDMLYKQQKSLLKDDNVVDISSKKVS